MTADAPLNHQATDVDAALVQRMLSSKKEVLVLPYRGGPEGPIYTEASIPLVKNLRAGGIDAAFLDPSDGRLFEGKKGSLNTALYTVSLGIASNAAWDLVKAILLSGKDRLIRVRYLLKNNNGAWVSGEIIGKEREALDALERIFDKTDDDSNDGE